VIVASGTRPRASLSVSMPAEKLRSVIGHRTINRPMENLPSARHPPADRVECRRGKLAAGALVPFAAIFVAGLQVSRPVGETAAAAGSSRGLHGVRTVARPRSYRSPGSRGFLLAVSTIAATHSSTAAYSRALGVSRTPSPASSRPSNSTRPGGNGSMRSCCCRRASPSLSRIAPSKRLSPKSLVLGPAPYLLNQLDARVARERTETRLYAAVDDAVAAVIDVATFWRKIDVFGSTVNGLRPSKDRRAAGGHF
jgi:hypothetical protein